MISRDCVGLFISCLREQDDVADDLSSFVEGDNTQDIRSTQPCDNHNLVGHSFILTPPYQPPGTIAEKPSMCIADHLPGCLLEAAGPPGAVAGGPTLPAWESLAVAAARARVRSPYCECHDTPPAPFGSGLVRDHFPTRHRLQCRRTY
ncbi:hypothetical protein brsh051_15550 [Brooklawnia propionicigenes]|uniref:Uncharacterized protein n=1 Tax=Brooklawnia propionicigenes TaxID=3041175 RepID=A0AAN0MH62_9ACTN|nr:hypothetical protein brsh051_15550 [Brooklawnia sp. SH051]